MERAVITGANGMLGASLAAELLSHGAEVLALVRNAPGSRCHLPEHPRLRVVPCDLDALGTMENPERDKPYDVFYHFAWDGTYGSARDDALRQNGNIRHTLHAISMAHRLGCKRFVGAGSQAEYGPVRSGQKLTAATPAFPVTGYGMAKLAAGQLGLLHARQLGLEFVWVRVLSVYGPMEKPYSLTMSTILALLCGKETHFTPGEQLWDFLHCKDAARAFRLIGQRGHNEKTYVLGSGTTIPLAEALAILRDQINPLARLGIGDLPYPPNQVRYLCADLAPLTEDTGFVPLVPYAAGVASTIQWAKEQL